VSRAYVATAVGRLLGPAAAEHVARVPAGLGCAVCGAPMGNAAITASITVEPTGEAALRRVSYAHATCADSTVAEASSHVAGVAAAGGAGMWMSALVVPTDSGALPVLAAEVSGAAHAEGADGDLADLFVGGLRGAGFETPLLVSHLPARVPGAWLAVVDTDEEPALLLLLASDGEVLYDGTVVLAPGWLNAAEQAGGICALYAGPSGVRAAGHTGDRLRALRAAASAGRLAAGRIGVSRRPLRARG
jgi:hypothetical protein